MADGTKQPGFTIEDFLARSTGIESTIRKYRADLRLIEKWMGCRFEQATKGHVEGLKEHVRKMRSGRHYANLARMLFRAAGKPGFVDILRVKGYTARLSPSDVLTLPEVNSLIAASTSLRDRALFVMLWETGARIHEILALNIGDIRQQKSSENGGRTVLSVWFQKVKVQGEEHTSYILEGPEHIMSWIVAHPAPLPNSPLFVSYAGNRLGVSAAERIVADTAKRAKLGKRVFPHLFRHSRATHLLRLGVPEMQVKRLLGWTPGSPMLARYAHLVDRDGYAALLRAHGLKEPETAQIESIISAGGDLQPVVPLMPPPGLPAHTEQIRREIGDLLTEHILANPKLQAAVAKLLGAVSSQQEVSNGG